VSRGSLTTIKSIRDFVTGGDAVFTIENGTTGVHYTYRVRCPEPRPDEDPEQERSLCFVDVLTGPNNEDDYSPVGIMTWGNGRWNYRHYDGSWGAKRRCSQLPEDAPSVLGFLWLLDQLTKADDKGLKTPAAFYHEGRCCVCGRALTTPESVAAGVGPVCAERGR
jgi:hypothetical protein